jgi:predicted PurR-regulated permease PerM
MTEPPDRRRLEGIFLIVLALLITAVFFQMVRGFIESLFLAAVFSGMLYGLYRRLARRLGGRKPTAAVLTILLFVLALIVPLSAFLGLVVSQAIEVSTSVGPWVENELTRPNQIDGLLQRLPFWETIQPYQDLISTKAAELAGHMGTFLVASVAAASRGTAVFFFHLFLMLYAMFFFLLRGKEYLARILYYIPLAPDSENRLVAKFVSVARATIKGTLVIGVIQGGLGGLGFVAAGIQGWAFWSVVMVILSIIPGIGTALVWVPAVIYLFAVGFAGKAIALGLWCALVVGMVDNLLRPRLVGRDTEMSDLLVLISTLGGIIAFGATGFIIGPIVAALWVTVWEIYGEMFSEVLPLVEMPVTETVAGMPVVVPPGADSRPRKSQPPDISLPWAKAADPSTDDADEGSGGQDP